MNYYADIIDVSNNQIRIQIDEEEYSHIQDVLPFAKNSNSPCFRVSDVEERDHFFVWTNTLHVHLVKTDEDLLHGNQD